MHQLALALAHALEHGARAVFGHVHDQALHRLVQFAVDGFVQHLRRAHLKFVPFAAHGLDEDGEMHLPPAADLKSLRRIGIFHFQRNVAQKFAVQPVPQMTGGDELPLFPCKRAVVDRKGHFNGRFADLYERNSFHAVGRTDGIADVDAFQPRKADDVARLCALDGHARKPFDLIEVDELPALVERRNIVIADRDFTVCKRRAALDPADADPADVFVVVDRGHEQLQRRRFVRLHGRDMIQNGIEQRGEVFAVLVRVTRRRARPARTEQNGTVELFVARVEVDQQLQNFILDLCNARIGTVDLVDDNDELVPQLQRLLHDKARLRHRSFRRVHEKQNAVHHLQNALHLAAEIGVPRRIDDIDLHSVVMHGGVLRKDGDAALALQRARIHNAFLHHLIFAESTALFQHLIDKRRLAVVNVRDDRHVP